MTRTQTRRAGHPRAGTAAGAVPAVAERLEGRRLMSTVFGLQTGNSLVAFDTEAPGTILATVKVKGLERRESLLGIDFRPANQTLYGVGSSNRLYTIDTTTGAATPVGTTTFAVPLNGTVFGVDFNPAADRLRVISEANQNLRINPNDGTVVDFDANTAGTQADANVAYDAADVGTGADPAIVASAYTNNDTDAGTGTLLFNIDAGRDVLTRQGSPDGAVSPNGGTQFTVGALGVDVQAVGGFDVETAGAANTAYAALNTSLRGAPQLYTVDLGTGAATAVGNIGRARKPLLGIAVAPRGTSFFVVTTRNDLLRLNTATPSLVLSTNRVTGLSSSRERIVGIDFRPLTGEMWALSDAERLYTINPGTAVAAPVGDVSAVALTDRASFGFDFNPTVDRIRVVNTAGQNLRFNPTTGAVVDFDPADADLDPDTGLAYVPGDANAGRTPGVAGAAYTNNVAAGTPTTLYVVDSDRDVLATQGSVTGTPTVPNTGQLFTVGATTVNVPDQVGFDIRTTGGSDAAFAVFAPGNRGATGLYSVNLATGAFTLVNTLNKRVRGVVGLAVSPA